MYDYQNDNEQLSEENEVGAFPNGGGISSDFKLHKESLPQWAIDWAKNRFNMDAKSVKFYVMDEQETDGPYAVASGNNILITSGFRNDETVIKHELTHIYQQAIGTATESNAGDASLEDEAVQVSKEGETALAKNQIQSDRYILPREKTNVVQFLAIQAIMGIALAGVGIAAWLGYKTYNKLNHLHKVKRLRKIAEKTGADEEIVRKLYNIFSWDKYILSNKKSEQLNEFERICKVVGKKPEMLEQVRKDNKKLEALYGGNGYLTTEYDDGKNGKKDTRLSNYALLVESGFEGFTEKENEILKSEFHVPYCKYNQNGVLCNDESLEAISCRGKKYYEKEIQDGYDNYTKLYVLTKGFKDRSIDEVKNDIDILFRENLGLVKSEHMETYVELYKLTDGFNDRISEDVKTDIEVLFRTNLNSVTPGDKKTYIELYKNGLRDIGESLSIAKLSFGDSKDKELDKLFLLLLQKTSCFKNYVKSMEDFKNLRNRMANLLGIKMWDLDQWSVLTEVLVGGIENIGQFSIDKFLYWVKMEIEKNETYAGKAENRNNFMRDSNVWSKEILHMIIAGAKEPSDA